MKNKLTSIVAMPLVLTVLAGCGSSPVIKEESTSKRYIDSIRLSIAYIQSDYPRACDCFSISIKIEDVYKDLAQLKEIEESSLEALQKNPKNRLEKKYLEDSLVLKEAINKKKKELIDELKNCGCYEIEL